MNPGCKIEGEERVCYFRGFGPGVECLINNVSMVGNFLDVGVRPGSRGPFVSAKGPKTIDAPSGLSEEEGR